jgi:MerR family transcriptional regulator, light-induced transcriptional regulator
MGQYSIKSLEEITGIKAHTIRIWEKRYNIVTPQRTDTNIRYYTDSDLKKLLSVSTLNDYGIKISHIANMSDEQINEEILKISESRTGNHAIIDTLKIAMIEYNGELLDYIFEEQVRKRGLERTVIEIIYPFFEKVGMLWLTGTITPAQEHFVSNFLRQKLFKIIDTTKSDNKKTSLLFLFEGEWHELGLLFYATLLKMKGHKIIYLGQSVPTVDINTAIDQIRPHYALTSFISTDGLNYFSEQLNIVSENHPKTQFIVSGASSSQVNFKKFPKNVHQALTVDAIKSL